MPICFIISPIGEAGSKTRRDADLVRRLIIEPALSGRFTIKRADDDNSNGRVSDTIFKDIRNASLCIVDLTGLNPNVMIELGVRLLTGRDYIILFKKGEKIPFDISDIRLIEYNLAGKGPLNAIQRIGARLESLRQAKITQDEDPTVKAALLGGPTERKKYLGKWRGAGRDTKLPKELAGKSIYSDVCLRLQGTPNTIKGTLSMMMENPGLEVSPLEINCTVSLIAVCGDFIMLRYSTGQSHFGVLLLETKDGNVLSGYFLKKRFFVKPHHFGLGSFRLTKVK